MIKIDFEEPRTDMWKNWRKKCKRKTDELLKSVDKNKTPVIDDIYKDKAIKGEIYLNIDGPFHGKCAYCECDITANQYGDIDHFRPKKGVTDENDEPIMIEDASGRRVEHPGYYWLAYEWDNLLPSCEKCNRQSHVKGTRIGKHSRFPVNGDHATTPEEVKNEKPLLINPVTEDPKEHLEFDVKTGFMKPLTSRGEMCIDIFGLNLRDRLVDDRKRAVDEVKATLVEIIHNPLSPDKNEALRKLIEVKEGKSLFSKAGLAALENLEPFLAPLFQ